MSFELDKASLWQPPVQWVGAGRAVVLGSNGYLGSHILQTLQAAGADVMGATRTPRGVSGTLQCDVTDRRSVEHVVGDAAWVFYLAGRTGTVSGFDNYREFVETNEIGLLNVLDHIRSQSSKAKVIFPSSRLVYRGSTERLREHDTLEARTIYAANKLASENYLRMYAACFGVRYAVFRIGVAFGNHTSNQWKSHGTVAHFVREASQGKAVSVYGDGRQRRSLGHIEDIVQLILRAAWNNASDGETYNVAGVDELSIGEVASRIARVYGVAVNQVPWPSLDASIESGDTVLDCKKVELLVGERPRHDFAQWLEDSARSDVRLPVSNGVS